MFFLPNVIWNDLGSRGFVPLSIFSLDMWGNVVRWCRTHICQVQRCVCLFEACSFPTPVVFRCCEENCVLSFLLAAQDDKLQLENELGITLPSGRRSNQSSENPTKHDCVPWTVGTLNLNVCLYRIILALWQFFGVPQKEIPRDVYHQIRLNNPKIVAIPLQTSPFSAARRVGDIGEWQCSAAVEMWKFVKETSNTCRGTTTHLSEKNVSYHPFCKMYPSY